MTKTTRWMVGLLGLVCLGACGAGVEPSEGGSLGAAHAPDDGGGAADAGAAGSDQTASATITDGPTVCGNGSCDGAFEDCLTCPVDCGLCTVIRDNEGMPTPGNCRRGAGSCGNGVCQLHACENASTCPSDCDAVCGDGFCTHGETSGSCPLDCGEPRTCENGGLRCGDGLCNCAEDWTNCHDCVIGPCNHNGLCDAELGENALNCPDCSP